MESSYPSDLCAWSAVALARALGAGTISACEVVSAHLARIDRTNPAVNALVTILPERAMALARAADESLARGELAGPLHGLPIAHKDLFLTKGIRTTFGSPIYRDFIPTDDSLIVERARRAGAIVVGKTNTPEFGAGSQTFNTVFGATRNPFDVAKTCGGSSGGAAVALACGMLPIADGTDMGGSLRNPASFCGVVGLRPSAGRVPVWPASNAFSTLSVDGPLARSVTDVALLLSVLAGPDRRSPISIEESAVRFRAPLDRDFKGARVAWWTGLGGVPFDRRISVVVNAQRQVFESLGCIVDDAEPDLSGADDVFKTLRAQAYVTNLGEVVNTHRDLVKDTVRWEIERGERLTATDLARAERLHTEIYHRARRFFETYEFLVLPVTQVLPFDVDQPYPTEVQGVPMSTYIDWMKSCYYITVAGTPAISVPCGFSPEGLPIGLQIVGRHRDDWGLLQIAHAFEGGSGVEKRWPEL